MAEWMQAQWKQNLGITVGLAKHGVEDVPGGAVQSLNSKDLREVRGELTTWIRSRF